MDFVIKSLTLVKNTCNINEDIEPPNLGQIRLEFRLTRVDDSNEELVSADFVFDQKGFDLKEKQEFFSIISQFHLSIGLDGKSNYKEVEKGTIEKKLLSKVYPYMRSHHLNLMHLMGIKAELPWDLPSELIIKKTSETLSDSAKRNKPPKTVKNLKSKKTRS